MCLFGPLPMPGWFGSLGKLLYIVAVSLAAAALGNIFLWSDAVFYPFYLQGDSRHHLSPLADQNLAGAVMMVEVSLFTIGLFWWLFRRSAREAVERQELLDFARVTWAPAQRSAGCSGGLCRDAVPSFGSGLRAASEVGDAQPALRLMRDSMILGMCVGCAMAAASAASGFRTWLQTHHYGVAHPSSDAGAYGRGHVRRRAGLDDWGQWILVTTPPAAAHHAAAPTR